MRSPGDEHLGHVREAVGDRAGKVWLRMLYRCETCATEGWIAAECGVEGPPDLRANSLFVASPFSFGCACGGRASHVEFRRDEEFEPRPPVPGEHLFVLPESNWSAGARLVLDEGNFT